MCHLLLDKFSSFVHNTIDKIARGRASIFSLSDNSSICDIPCDSTMEVSWQKKKKETHNTVRHRNENVFWICIRSIDRRISTHLSVTLADGIGWKNIEISFPRRSKAANIFPRYNGRNCKRGRAYGILSPHIVTFVPLFHKSGSAELLKFSSGFSILRHSTLLSIEEIHLFSSRSTRFNVYT